MKHGCTADPKTRSPVNSDRLKASGRRDLHANMRWLKEHAEEFSGRWVALCDGALRASDSSRAKLQRRLEGTLLREVTVLKVDQWVGGIKTGSETRR